MRRYSIGEVSRLLEVKAHVIRYWEQEISLLSPKKDRGGRRYYDEQDLNLLYRLRYLIRNRLLTAKGAEQRLIAETADSVRNRKAGLSFLRASLLRQLDRVEERRAQLEKLEKRFHSEEKRPGIEDLFLEEFRRAVIENKQNRREMHRLPVFLPNKDPGSEAFRYGESQFARARLAILTTAISDRNFLEDLPGREAKNPYQVIADKIRAATHEYGRQPLWILCVPADKIDIFQTYCRNEAYFKLRKDRIILITQKRSPALDKEGRLIPLDRKGEGKEEAYLESEDSLSDALRRLRALFEEEHAALKLRDIKSVCIQPIDNLLAEFPDPLFLGLHSLYASQLSLKAVPAKSGKDGLYRITGQAIIERAFLEQMKPADFIRVKYRNKGLESVENENMEYFINEMNLLDLSSRAQSSMALAVEEWYEGPLAQGRRRSLPSQAMAIEEKEKRSDEGTCA